MLVKQGFYVENVIAKSDRFNVKLLIYKA